MKKNIKHSIFLLFTFICIGLYAQTAGETYFIQSAIAGKNLDVKWGKTDNGTPLHLWPKNGGNAQKFTLENAGGGYFYIKSALGKYIHVQNRSNQPRALALIWEGRGNDNTKWKFVPASNGYFYIQSKKGTYLDVQLAKSANGTPIWMWRFNGGNAQKWKLNKVASNQITAGTYTIQSAIAGKHMDVKWGKNTNGTPLHLWPKNGGNAQKFILEDAGGGYFYIKSALGKYVHTQHASPRALAHLWESKGNNNSKWKFTPTSNGYYFIQSKNGTNLDVKLGKSDNGTPIWMWPHNGGNAQKWKLNKIAGDQAYVPIILSTEMVSNYFIKVAAAQQGNSQNQKAGGPNFEETPLAIFSRLDADLSSRFGDNATSKFSRLDANIITDKVPGSGVFYYTPNSYHLYWDVDQSEHGLSINYARNTEGRENKSTRVSATLTSGITIKERKFMENMIREILKNKGVANPRVELKPLPVEKPEIEFHGGGFDISGDQITIVAFSDFGENIKMSFTTSDDNIDALKNGELQNKLSFSLLFKSSLDENQTYDIPADISIMDEKSYGILEVEFPSLDNVVNNMPYPIKAQYLHILTTAISSGEIIPYIYSFDLGNKIVQPNDIIKLNRPTGFSIPNDLRSDGKPIRAFIEYRLQNCEPCTQEIINQLTGGATAATKQEIKFSTINLLKSTGATYADIYIRSKQLDPSKQKTITTYDPLRIDEDNADFKSPVIYLFNGEQPDFEYRIELFTEEDQYDSDWITGNKQRITLSKSRLEEHFNSLPGAEDAESSGEEDNGEN